MSNPARDATTRNVIGFAHQVRLHLHDSRVIVGSIVLAAEQARDFQIRPWGLRSTMTVRFDDVVRAVPIRKMLWAQQQSIAAAQIAGVFTKSTPVQDR